MVNAPTAAPTLSAEQQRTALWADPRCRVYALIATANVPGVRERVAAADVDDWDGLWTGELDAEERAAAPLVVALRRESPFTDWLLGEAAQSFARWGVLAQSAMPFLDMRTHGRALCRARLPNGQAIRIDWMDPQVLDALLPLAAPEQLERVYAGVNALVGVAQGTWTRWSIEAGRLARRAGAAA